MKTNAIIRIIVWSLVLILLTGILLAGLGVYYFSFIPGTHSQSGFVTYDGTAEIHVDAATIRKVKIEWVSDSITIRPGDVDDLVFAEPDGLDDEWKMTYEQSGDQVTIHYSSHKNMSFGINVHIPSKPLTVTVPREWSGKLLKIETVSSEVDIRDLAPLSELKIEIVSGETVCENLSCDTLDLESVSGSIRYAGQVGSVDAETVSGDCTLVLPADIPGFTAKCDGLSGKVRCDFPGQLEDKTVIYGDGSCHIKMDSVSGNLAIEKAA